VVRLLVDFLFVGEDKSLKEKPGWATASIVRKEGKSACRIPS
jgi:hypothetical protein